jgi:hypothetical protein
MDGLEWEGVIQTSEDVADDDHESPVQLPVVRKVELPAIPDWWSGPK